MNKTHFHIIIICLATIFSCGRSADNNNIEYAERELFYYNFIDHENSVISQKIKQYIERKLSSNDFALIDNSTSSTWPYYTKLTLNEDVPIDSIMFPHKTVHRLILYNETNPDPNIQYKLDVTYNLPLEDGTPNIKIIKYRRDMDSNWEKVVDLGIENFDKAHFRNEKQIAQGILEHLLIYSWK